MITITYEDQGNKGRYVAHVDGHDGTGELTISKLSDTTLIADHTGTDDSLRGMGVAKALVERLVADARAAGQKIVPLCPYVRAQAQKHGDAWADVIQR
ncbi:MAG: GNAT family N-acetyltransferase [Pseudomonadota bacterium]